MFWTKNPIPMLPRLSELDAYKYYFQFTLTGYGKDMETNLPDKKGQLIPAFQELAVKIGKKRVIWRYDPIVFTKKYTPEYHIRAFTQIAEALDGCTEKCVISFVDIYAKNRKNMQAVDSYEMSHDDLEVFAKAIADIARSHGMAVATCAEVVDLDHGVLDSSDYIKGLLDFFSMNSKYIPGKDDMAVLQENALVVWGKDVFIGVRKSADKLTERIQDEILKVEVNTLLYDAGFSSDNETYRPPRKKEKSMEILDAYFKYAGGNPFGGHDESAIPGDYLTWNEYYDACDDLKDTLNANRNDRGHHDVFLPMWLDREVQEDRKRAAFHSVMKKKHRSL